MKTKVTHIGIYTPNLERLKDFYIKYFDAKCNDKYVNSKGFSSYFLTFDSDVRVEIMANTKLEYHKFVDLESGMNHLAFSVGTLAYLYGHAFLQEASVRCRYCQCRY